MSYYILWRDENIICKHMWVIENIDTSAFGIIHEINREKLDNMLSKIHNIRVVGKYSMSFEHIMETMDDGGVAQIADTYINIEEWVEVMELMEIDTYENLDIEILYGQIVRVKHGEQILTFMGLLP